MDLFRRQVFESRQENWLGSVHLATARLGWAVAAFAALFTFALVVMLGFGQYTRSEHVAGQLVPSEGLLQVKAPGAGIATQVHVREGEAVEAGQALVKISAERDSESIGQVGAAVGYELDSQRRRLQLQLDELDSETAREKARLQQKLHSLRRRLELILAQLDVREQQLRSAENLLEQIEPVRDTGQLSALQLNQFESIALESRAQYELARLNHLSAQQDVRDIEAELDRLPGSAAASRRDIERALSDVAQAIARNESERSLVLRSPRAGLVSGLNISGGQSVSQGQPLLAIIPEDSRFLAELWVPPHAVGRIEIGGRVAMRYHAYPYQQFGQHYGRIVEIAHRALRPEEFQFSSGQMLSEPAYRVRVEPENQQVMSGGVSHPLRTSMTLDAALLLDRRRLIELLGIGTGGGQQVEIEKLTLSEAPAP